MNNVIAFIVAFVLIVFTYFIGEDTESLIGCILFFVVFFGVSCSLKLDDIKNALEKEAR